MKKILKVIQSNLIILILAIFLPTCLLAQKIEIGEKGVSINSTIIKNENDVKQALGSPTKKALYPDSIKGGYWEYSELGITVYFTEKENVKKCDLSIMCEEFTGEFIVGKTKLDRETHIYKLLQFDELNFKPIEIEPIPQDPSKFVQFIDAECYGKDASFIYFRQEVIGRLSIDLY
jgi:hypothetical protein